MLTFLYFTLFLSVLQAVLGDEDAAKRNKFRLVTSVTRGDKKFDGLYISTFHTGAGTNAAVALKPHKYAVPFSLNRTYLEFPVGEYPYSLGLDHSRYYNSTQPADYKYIEISAGHHTKGFSLNKESIVKYAGDIDFKTFVVCRVKGIAPYVSAGPQRELLWRTNKGKASYKRCADVKLQAEHL